MFEALIFSNLIFWIIWMNLDIEITKSKLVDLNEIYNFVVDIFIFKIIYGTKILFKILIFWNSDFSVCSMVKNYQH